MFPADKTVTLFGQRESTLEADHLAAIHLPGVAEAPTEPSPEGNFERHWLRTLAHVLVEEVHELYRIQELLDKHLSPVANAATEPILRYLGQIHARQTSEHLRRLASVHQMLGQTPDERICLDLEGLLIGLQETIAENRPGRGRDVALVAITHKIMLLEITSYCNARDYAQLLGLEPVAAVLQKCLEEENSLKERVVRLKLLLEPAANAWTIR